MKTEQADNFVAELGALLHDVADWKFSNGNEFAGSEASRKWLLTLNVPEEIIQTVCEIVDNVSYKGANVENKMVHFEGKIV